MKLLKLMVCFLTSVSIASSQTLAPTIDNLQRSSNPHINKYAYVLKDSVWKTTNLYVCWENPEDRFKQQMATVQKAIYDTWQHESKLQFTGWQKCAARNHGIRILIDDSGPLTKVLGRQLDGVKNGVVLNLTFANWSTYCQAKIDYCIRGIAIHEFGHAIGFAHEQNSPSAPGECQILKQGPNGDELLTPYDPNSVMNYCFENWTDGKLSALDISAAQELYGTAMSASGGSRGNL